MNSGVNLALNPILLFPPTSWWVGIKEASSVQLCGHEKWQKQSLRSKIRIASAQGPLTLSVPTRKKSRKSILNVEIAQEERWHLLWWKSLQTAYNNSAYFEFYAPELKNLLDKYSAPGSLLHEFSLDSLNWVSKKLGFPEKFELNEDCGVVEKIQLYPVQEYAQVFEAETGFIPDLSVLDLLFNLGPEAGSFILQQHPSH